MDVALDILFYGGITLIVVLAVVLAILVHAGLFYELRIRSATPASFPHRVAYRVHKGPYKKAGAAFKELSEKWPKLKTFAIFYDDPKEVNHEGAWF